MFLYCPDLKPCCKYVRVVDSSCFLMCSWMFDDCTQKWCCGYECVILPNANITALGAAGFA